MPASWNGQRVVIVAGMVALVALVLGAAVAASDPPRQATVYGLAMMMAAPAMLALVSALNASSSAHHAKEANVKADTAAGKAAVTAATVEAIAEATSSAKLERRGL